MTALIEAAPSATIDDRSQDAGACDTADARRSDVHPADIVGRVDHDRVPARGATRFPGPGTADPGITLDALPGRELDQDELLALVGAIAAKPADLQQHIAFDDDRRHYVSLHRDTHVDVWLLCWTPQNDTGWHDHDISSGAVAVTQGTLTEHNLAIGTPSIETEIHAGSAFSFGPDHIHRLTGRDQGSVSVHAYSPPLWRMGQYTLGAGGQLRRRSVSYADELRPLDDMA